MGDQGDPVGVRVEPHDLVGRDAELAVLRDALGRASGGTTEAVLVAAEPGLGKTTLVRALERDAHSRDFATAWGHCWGSVETPPLWAWSQILRTLHPESDWTDVAPWVASELRLLVSGEFVETPPDDVQAGHARFILFSAVGAFLRQLSQAQPLMIVIEDLHAANESELLLFRSLVEGHRSDAILLIGTFDPKGVRFPGHAALIDEIGRSSHLLSLPPLKESDVSTLFDRLSSSPASEEILSVVFEATEGNPFFVKETARLLSSKGSLNRPDYSRGFRVPEGARGLIRARLMSLDDDAQELLGVAAVLGREFDVGLLAEVTELPRDTVLDLLDQPVTGAVIEESGVGRFRFTHVLLRETAYEDLKAGKRMRLHRRVAEVLESLYEDEELNHAQELAHHWFKAAQAGDATKTIRFSEMAAEQALASHAYAEAERLYQRALKASETLRSSSEVRDRLKRCVDHSCVTGSAATALPVEAPRTEAVLKKDGDFWQVTFEGETTLLKDSKGLGYMAKLLKNPGREVHSLELAMPTGRTAVATEGEALRSDALGDVGPILDETAKKAYKRRIDELEAEIEEAEFDHDIEKAARAHEERSLLIQQIGAAMGLGGRDRRTGSAAERARVSVTRNVKEALRRISEALPPLGEHLQATVRTGTYCSYTPDPRLTIEWTT